jgi:hypothetical protein
MISWIVVIKSDSAIYVNNNVSHSKTEKYLEDKDEKRCGLCQQKGG